MLLVVGGLARVCEHLPLIVAHDILFNPNS
jgi:hypothetical protein